MLIDVAGREAYAYTGGKAFDATLPTVVFIHGAQNDHSVWILQSRYLAHHGRGVLALDLPGHGRSAGPALGTIEEMADWTLAVVAAAGARDVVIVGHSMGSLIAVEAAARNAGGSSSVDVVGVVPIAAAFPMRVSDALLDATAHDEPRAIGMVSTWSSETAWGGFSQKPSAPGPGFGVVWGNRRLMQRQTDGVMHVDFVACNAYANGDAAASAVRCPARFVVAEKDAMTPARAGRAFAARVAGAELVEIPRAGHTVMSEAPDATLAAIMAFLERIGR
jgi:pimeloyl-ACP methyl ester carboxylesterase